MNVMICTSAVHRFRKAVYQCNSALCINAEVDVAEEHLLWLRRRWHRVAKAYINELDQRSGKLVRLRKCQRDIGILMNTADLLHFLEGLDSTLCHPSF